MIPAVERIETGASAAQVLNLAARRSLAYDFTVWFWGDAIAVDGLLEAAKLLGQSVYREHVRKFCESWSRRTLSWPDHLAPGAALLDLGMKDSALRLAQWLIEAPRCQSGSPMYRPDIPAYRHTVWVDTLYHCPSFFASLGSALQQDAWVNLALDEWFAHTSVLSSPGGPYLAHSYDSGSRLLHGYGWGRGCGWALLGMIDTLELLPPKHPRRDHALQETRDLAAAVLSAQDTTGFWRTLLHDPEAYCETSTATFFGAAFTKGARLGLLSRTYREAAEQAWQATLGRVAADGSLLGVSACTYAGVANLEDSTMYKTLPTEVNVWGQGSLLRFAAERMRAELR
ncbi:MAG: glycoside hydrolase family 88 protein [Gammaproteobacteria bacterium]|nr:glycoside hydrolase family 88 protein [Gammaproteobacteria bacterium]